MSVRTGLAMVCMLAVAACVSMPPDGGHGKPLAANCDADGGACHVTLSVTNCKITPEPQELIVDKKNVVIHFDLEQGWAGYYFDDDSSVFIKDRDPDRQFTQFKRQNKQKFTIHDKNRYPVPGESTYRYGVKIKHGNNEDCPPYDPTIVNKG
ncbi:MAG TPA: hypothetical protein VGI14_06295 [Casimicrobiaceae bacterium]|jgi:hypothetical protein